MLKEVVQYLTLSDEYVALESINGLIIDLRYGSTNNFVGQDMYGDFKAFLHKIAAEKLAKAVKNLSAIEPKYKLIIFDALRPRAVQRILWDKVKGTDQEMYVANPQNGSVHNFGFAVDLSIVDGTGKELDMGTEFDSFNSFAQPQLEEQFIKESKLTEKQIRNRRLLRRVMEEAGFIQLPFEWWHYDALPKSEVKEKFKIIE